jgi:uncharacterized protein (TIGR03790 family)
MNSGRERRYAAISSAAEAAPREVVLFMAITRIISLCGDPSGARLAGRLFRAEGAGRENVLLVVNRADKLSRRIADYYIPKRGIPLKNVCKLDISRRRRDLLGHLRGASRAAHRPLSGQGRSARAGALHRHHHGSAAEGERPRRGTWLSEACAVDSELTLLYSKMKGKRFARAGLVPNPFYRQKDQPFTHARFPIYLVTRLAGYDFDDVKGMIDRSLAARNRGKFVFDLKSDDDAEGNNWLRTAAWRCPKSAS